MVFLLYRIIRGAIMDILSIIDKIFENDYFTKILVIAIIILVILFIIVLLLGMKDAKKAKEPKKVKEEDIKDITFEPKTETPPVKEDVTFEMPVLTKNLEEFKKNFEEEIQKEQDVEVRTTAQSSLSESTKPVKILDINIIEDTAVLSPVADEPEKIVTHDVDKKEIFKSKKEPVEEKIDDDKLHFLDDDEF